MQRIVAYGVVGPVLPPRTGVRWTDPAGGPPRGPDWMVIARSAVRDVDPQWALTEVEGDPERIVVVAELSADPTADPSADGGPGVAADAEFLRPWRALCVEPVLLVPRRKAGDPGEPTEEPPDEGADDGERVLPLTAAILREIALRRAAAWERLADAAQSAAARVARKLGFDAATSDDLAQEALRALFARCRAGAPPRNRRRWLVGVVRKLALRILTGRRTELGAIPRVALGLDEQAAPAAPDDPSAAVSRRDLGAWARERLALLPAPYLEIARWQYQDGRGRAEVIALLRGWRPVSEDTARRLLRETHAMLREIGEGRDPRERWPRRYDSGRNRFLVTPLPPESTL